MVKPRSTACVAASSRCARWLGDKITDGLLDQARDKAVALKDALDQATPGINSVREALKQLGVTSEAELKKTAADAKRRPTTP